MCWRRIIFLSDHLTFLIVLQLLLFCWVPKFLLMVRVASCALNLLFVARPRDSAVLCLLLQAASPTWIFVYALSLVVGKDTVSSAHCFLPDAEDRHTNHLCLQVFVVNYHGEFTKDYKNTNYENDTKVTEPYKIFACWSLPTLV